jgi:hypothetical protein
VGLAYYRIKSSVLEELRPLIAAHEAEPVGPRARGYWFDWPVDYDYEGVRSTAQRLDLAGKENAIESMELSEVQAHALSMLDVELPRDDAEFPPALFAASVEPDALRNYMKIARRSLGSNPERAAAQFAHHERDPRFSAYMDKQIRHLREALPLVWHFHERAVEAGDAVLVVDLRARDLEIPEAIELENA